ncbi:NAD-dependent epimerase/dehydratase family protein [Marinitoga litoralis]|uniref:NAD-dependent epimerase/dehydratase family protein n=1 Tax=Marinitoga litoralis TaxID=570855 RepID=UPI00195F629F|nr:NAD(P)-dependent oxidoreductase [Marinitoga litoralis]MBM7560307.1 nucleoside-diphosphate-sugar epimerase [Marinitoga litoralis]
MKILVTGALGFIGKSLFAALKKEGYEVQGIDLVIADYDDYIRADITYFEDVWKLFKDNNGFDMVIHLAGEVGRLNGEEYPQRMIYVNEFGTLNLIKMCIEYKSKLVYFSTSEVYGTLFDEKEVMEEDFNVLSPTKVTNIYAMSKLFGEGIVNHYVKNYGLLAVGIRPFMVYGPGVIASKYKSAIDQFIYNALNDNLFTVHKSSERAWCYVDDFVNGVLTVIKHHEFKEKNYETYNIGTQEYIATEELAKLILELTGKPYDLMRVVELPDKFISGRKRFFNEKLRKLGWEQKVPLREGLMKVIEWYRGMM